MDATKQRPAHKSAGRPANSQPLHVAQIQGALLTLKNAGQLMGASEDTIRRRAKADPTFPKFVKLGNRCTRLPASEFMAWLRAQGGQA